MKTIRQDIPVRDYTVRLFIKPLQYIDISVVCDETEHLDYACYEMFGHSDWEYVEDKDTHITIKFNVEDTREEEKQKGK